MLNRPAPFWKFFSLFLLITIVTLQLPPLLAEEGGSTTTQAILEPAVTAKLSSQILARISKVGVNEGDFFKNQQSLVTFDCAMPKALLVKAQAQLRAVQKQYQVNQRMQELETVSQLEMVLSRANVEQIQAEVGIAQVEVERCEIHAPYAGRVVKRYVNPFDSVRQGEPLLDILGEGNLKVRLYVPADWLPTLTPGQTFQVTINRKTYAARVTTIGAQVDPASQTLAVRGEIQGPHGELLAGMSGSAHFPIAAEPVQKKHGSP